MMVEMLLVIAWAAQAAAPVQVPPPAQQIAVAVQAAPDDRREGATVLGYDERGTLGTLRAGTNDLVCLGDDPKVDGINVACYHKDLEPFMARGRELSAKGVTSKEREETRWKEIESGALKMPREPRTLHVLTGIVVVPTPILVEVANLPRLGVCRRHSATPAPSAPPQHNLLRYSSGGTATRSGSRDCARSVPSA